MFNLTTQRIWNCISSEWIWPGPEITACSSQCTSVWIKGHLLAHNSGADSLFCILMSTGNPQESGPLWVGDTHARFKNVSSKWRKWCVLLCKQIFDGWLWFSGDTVSRKQTDWYHTNQTCMLDSLWICAWRQFEPSTTMTAANSESYYCACGKGSWWT